MLATASGRAVRAVDRTGNVKTGEVAATYVSGSTCPAECPFKAGGGCYGEGGRVGMIAARLDGPAELVGDAETAAIDGLAARTDLRLHVYGDFADASHARKVSAACRRYARRADRAGRSVTAWAYTHRWRTIPRPALRGVPVLASCETERQVRQANARGYAACLAVESFPSDSAFTTADGLTVVPCPAQTRGRTCVDCRLCLDADRLLEAGLTIGFRPQENQTRSRFVRSLRTVNAS